MNEYDIIIVKLTDEDGGGFAGFVPDLPGCISDGETRLEAMANTENAIKEWIDAQKGRGLPVPKSGSFAEAVRENYHQMAIKLNEIIDHLSSIDSRVEKLEYDVSYIREIVENLEERERYDKVAFFPIGLGLKAISLAEPHL